MQSRLGKWIMRWIETCSNARPTGLWSAGQSPPERQSLANNHRAWHWGWYSFNIFINDLDDGAECLLGKYAHQAELGGVTDRVDGSAAIQRHLKRLQKSSDKKLSKFNKGRCQILHLGKNKPMNQAWGYLKNSFVEQHRLFLVDNKLIMSKQCSPEPTQL